MQTLTNHTNVLSDSLRFPARLLRAEHVSTDPRRTPRAAARSPSPRAERERRCTSKRCAKNVLGRKQGAVERGAVFARVQGSRRDSEHWFKAMRWMSELQVSGSFAEYQNRNVRQVNQRGRERHWQTTAKGTNLTTASTLRSKSPAPRVRAHRAERGRDLRRQVCHNTLYVYRLHRCRQTPDRALGTNFVKEFRTSGRKRAQGSVCHETRCSRYRALRRRTVCRRSWARMDEGSHDSTPPHMDV